MAVPAKKPVVAKAAEPAIAPAPAPAAAPAPAFELPQVDVAKAIETVAAPARELQESVREAAEKGVEESRAAYARAKAVAEETAGSLGQSAKSAAEGMRAFNDKLVDAMRANTEAGFDFVKALLGAKTLSEAIELNTEFARKQFDAMNAQGKDLAAFAQKTATETYAPLKDGFSKAFAAR